MLLRGTRHVHLHRRRTILGFCLLERVECGVTDWRSGLPIHFFDTPAQQADPGGGREKVNQRSRLSGDGRSTRQKALKFVVGLRQALTQLRSQPLSIRISRVHVGVVTPHQLTVATPDGVHVGPERTFELRVQPSEASVISMRAIDAVPVRRG